MIKIHCSIKSYITKIKAADSIYQHILCMYVYMWHGGVMVRALDSRSRGHGFESHQFHLHGQVVHTHVPLSPSCIIWCWVKGGDALRLGR